MLAQLFLAQTLLFVQCRSKLRVAELSAAHQRISQQRTDLYIAQLFRRTKQRMAPASAP